MWVLVLLSIIFFVICIATELINKEKLAKKLNLEQEKVKKCPKCNKEYTDFKLKKCKECGSSLDEKIKYKLPKKLKKKINYISFGIVCVVVIGFCLYIGISNFLHQKQIKELYNNDLNLCYETIKNESNWNNFKGIVNNHTQELNFEPEAFQKLYQAVDERIENIKNGNEDKELVKMLWDIQGDKTLESTAKSILEKIEEKYLKANSYSNINKANKNIEEQKYKEAYDFLSTVISQNKDKNQDIFDIATNKQNEIKDKAMEQIIAQAQEKINAQDYSATKTLLEKYKNSGNQTILDMYNNATNEINRKEAEERARKEKEEAEEKARKAEEEKARKKSEGVRIGMTQQEVRDSMWGEPLKINTTTTKYGVHEQWVYGNGNYLYFENGILTSIQN